MKNVEFEILKKNWTQKFQSLKSVQILDTIENNMLLTFHLLNKY